ncbi:MAG TPA: hypothetical protein VJ898_13390 [Natrialbaceae archaeon]|nr:hypothetical protein [Natrialbaceae archaeon]
MATQSNLTTLDKAAMWLGGGLIILAIPVMGLIVTLAGSNSALYTYEVTQNGETVTQQGLSVPSGATAVTEPLFAPNLRGTIVLIGLAIFGLYAIYKFVVAIGSGAPEATPTGEPSRTQ